MDKKKLKKINKILYFSFFFFALSLSIFFVANRFIALQNEIFYSIGWFFLFLWLICMAVLCFLNGVYEIKNLDWFLTPFGYHSEVPFGWLYGHERSKTFFKIYALWRVIIGVGIFVFAMTIFVFAVRSLLG